MRIDKIKIFKPSINDSDCIYHYSKLDGVIGILSSKKIWMTNIRYLNDWMEGRYFYEQVFKMIEKEIGQIRKLDKIYEQCLRNTFVASFSETPDLLSQYKYYGNICIGFDVLGLHDSRGKLNNNPTSGFEVPRKVDYISIEKYSKVISEFSNDKKLIDGVINEDLTSLLTFFCFIGALKHPGFFEEKEYRLCHFWYEPADLKYRFSNGRHVPYIEFNLLPSTITQIIVGPDRIQNEIANDLQNFIKSEEELRHIDIRCSGIPFIP